MDGRQKSQEILLFLKFSLQHEIQGKASFEQNWISTGPRHRFFPFQAFESVANFQLKTHKEQDRCSGSPAGDFSHNDPIKWVLQLSSFYRSGN